MGETNDPKPEITSPQAIELQEVVCSVNKPNNQEESTTGSSSVVTQTSSNSPIKKNDSSSFSWSSLFKNKKYLAICSFSIMAIVLIVALASTLSNNNSSSSNTESPLTVVDFSVRLQGLDANTVASPSNLQSIKQSFSQVANVNTNNININKIVDLDTSNIIYQSKMVIRQLFSYISKISKLGFDVSISIKFDDDTNSVAFKQTVSSNITNFQDQVVNTLKTIDPTTYQNISATVLEVRLSPITPESPFNKPSSSSTTDENIDPISSTTNSQNLPSSSIIKISSSSITSSSSTSSANNIPSSSSITSSSSTSSANNIPSSSSITSSSSTSSANNIPSSSSSSSGPAINIPNIPLISTFPVSFRSPKSFSASAIIPAICGSSTASCLISVYFRLSSSSVSFSVAFNGSKGQDSALSELNSQNFFRVNTGYEALFSSSDLSKSCTNSDIIKGSCSVSIQIQSSSSCRGLLTISAGLSNDNQVLMSRALASGKSDLVDSKSIQDVMVSNYNNATTLKSQYLNQIWGSLSGLSWDPTHDSVQIGIGPSLYTYPLLVSNDRAKTAIFGVCGSALDGKSGRFIALGANPFHDVVSKNGRTNAVMDSLLQNAIKWLNNGVDPNQNPKFKIVISHITSSYWFNHDKTTRDYFVQRYPNSTINQINQCENEVLQDCLDNANLLVIGRQMGKEDDSSAPSSTTDANAVIESVQSFIALGGSVIYVNYYREQNDVSRGIYSLFGINHVSNNYWDKLKLVNISISNVTNYPVQQTSWDAIQTIVGKTPLVDNDMNQCTGNGGTPSWTNCGTESFKNKLSNGLISIRDTLSSWDMLGLDLFSFAGSAYLKTIVLLGDKFRINGTDPNAVPLTYLIPLKSYNRFAGAAFADASILYTRSSAPAQTDLGNLYCSKNDYVSKKCDNSWINSVPTLNSFILNEPLLMKDGWTSTGLFALPGSTIIVKRLDQQVNVKLSIRFFASKVATSPSFYTDGAYFKYYRPQFVQSSSISIPSSGKPVLITSPIGGPIYLEFSNTASISDPNTIFSLEFTNVAQHPSIMNIFNNTMTDYFIQNVQSNPIPYVDIKAEGFEIHLRKDRLMSSLQVVKNDIFDYTGPNGLQQMIYDFTNNAIGKIYNLAGLRTPGRPLDSTLSPAVLSVCNNLNLDCTNINIHRKKSLQHITYDEWTDCSLSNKDCSGDWWVTDLDFNPLDWFQLFNLGKGLQRTSLDIHWVQSSSDPDKWSNYQNRASLASPSIYSYFAQWKYYRAYKNYSAEIPQIPFFKAPFPFNSISYKDIFALIQSTLINATSISNSQLKRVAMRADCSVWKSLDLNVPTKQAMADFFYSDGWWSLDVEYRLAFYTQLAFLLEGRTMRDGTILESGFDIFTLLNQASRLLESWTATESTWLLNRKSIGFHNFNYSKVIAYGDNSVSSIIGNDFILVYLSYLSNMDLRPYWNVRSIPYTSQASQQIDSHIVNKVITGGAIQNEYVMIERSYPPNQVSSLPKTKLDGISAWSDRWIASQCTSPFDKPSGSLLPPPGFFPPKPTIPASQNLLISDFIIGAANTVISASYPIPLSCSNSCTFYVLLKINKGFPSINLVFNGTKGSNAAFSFSPSSSEYSQLYGGSEIILKNTDQSFTSSCDSNDISFQLCSIQISMIDTSNFVEGAISISAGPESDPQVIASRVLASGDSSLIEAKAIKSLIESEISNATNKKSIWVNEIWGSLEGVTWDPSHDSVFFSISDATNTIPLIISKDGREEKFTLGTCGVSLGGNGGRFVTLASNPFSDIERGGTNYNDAFDKLLQRMIRWLNYGVDPKTSPYFKVVTAHLPGQSSYWFNHDKSTKSYFVNRYPDSVTNTINTCDNDKLAGCLQYANLLVIGRQMGKADDSDALSDTTDANQVKLAVYNFLRQGGSVIYVNYYRDDNALSRAYFSMMGISESNSNLWSLGKLQDASASYILNANDKFTSIITSYNTVIGKTPLNGDDFGTCTNGETSTWRNCDNPPFKAKLSNGLIQLLDTLRSIHFSGVSLFGNPGSSLLKLIVVLGDKFRTNSTDPEAIPLTYPIPVANYSRFAAAAFSDSSVLYTRTKAPAQTDLGNLYFSKSDLHSKKGVHYSQWINQVPRYNNYIYQQNWAPADGWTTTGVFALPGEKFSVRRIDNYTDTTLYLRIFYQREGTTKALWIDSSRKTYEYLRPQFVQSGSILIPSDGTPLFLTAPWGGPIYLELSNQAAYASASSKPVYLVQFDNVSKHHSILDISNKTQVSQFVDQLLLNPIPFVDLRGVGFEVHARRDKLLSTLKPSSGLMDYSNGKAGVEQFLYDYSVNFVETVYTTAGFKLQGRPISQTLPAGVIKICQDNNLNCFDEQLHSRLGIQHSNYDDWANCGNGCSGNPWDADWSVTAIGWGEAHELGHNIQRGDLNIAWVPPGSNKDNWGHYQNRATENSNNIFPYVVIWKYWRWYRNYNGSDVTNMNYKETFAGIQSALVNTQATINGVKKKVILSPDCSIWKSYDINTPASQVINTAFYESDKYAADNDYRVGFYTQLGLMLHGHTFRGGSKLDVGFDIYTMMYLGARIFQSIAVDDAKWNAGRATLGFSMFPRTDHSVYNGKSVSSINGNDFLLVYLSYITNMDMRPYYDIRGIPYSSLANSQVQSNINNGIITGGKIPNQMVVNSRAYPPKDLSTLKRVNLDGTSAWPLDNWTVASCNIS